MISTKGRYALRVMIDLAENDKNGPVSLNDIAARQEISKKYLESIVRDLVKNELVISSSGRSGGYVLSRAPEDYPIGEILEKTEGPMPVVACLADDSAICPRAEKCKTLPLWNEFEKVSHDFFYSKKLSDLLKN